MFNVVLLIIYFGISTLVSCQNSTSRTDLGKVIFASVLFRHGDRAPVDPYPNDPYKNASFWPDGFGQLTNTGKQQEYELGKWLRRRYSTLLPEQYSKDAIYVRSTDYDRTLMSAESNLAGMFPPQGAQVWNPDLRWQPIPIHTLPEKLDKVLLRTSCPAYSKEYKKVLKSAEIQALITKYKTVFDVLNENTGKKITTLEDLEYIQNTLFIESLYNLTLPEWTRSVYPEPMEEAARYSFALPTWTQKLARLKMGLLLKEMTDHMTEKKSGQLQQKLWMYSAHDLTVASFLNSLGLFEPHCPPYASAVLVELRVDTAGAHYVTIFYRNSSAEEPMLLTLPNCDAVCPLDQFFKVCEPLIPQDWDKECLATSFADLYKSPYIIVLAVSSLLGAVLLVSVAAYRERTKRHTHCKLYRRMSVVPFDLSKTPTDESLDYQIKI